MYEAAKHQVLSMVVLSNQAGEPDEPGHAAPDRSAKRGASRYGCHQVTAIIGCGE